MVRQGVGELAHLASTELETCHADSFIFQFMEDQKMIFEIQFRRARGAYKGHQNKRLWKA